MLEEMITEILHKYCKEKIIENEEIKKELEKEIINFINRWLQNY